MALIKRADLLKDLSSSGILPRSQVYLFFGERYLCKEAADTLIKHLLAEQPGSLHTVDGDREDPGQTLARLMSFSLLPGRQIYRVADSRLFHSRTVAGDLWTKAQTSFDAGKEQQSLRSLRALLQAAGIKSEGTTSLSEISGPEWKKIFDFEKPAESLDWADRLLSGQQQSTSTSAADVVDRYIHALERGLPGGNILVIIAETVDKRQRLFTYLKKNGTTVDCSVSTGASSAAQQEQKEILKEMMLKTLADFQKTIDPKAVDIFFDRVGFHPVAVVTESEKLAHYCADRKMVTIDDLEEMVGRSREDALYELTDAFSKRQTGRTLTILSRLLEQGVHNLAILATMRNFLRKQLIFRSIQMQPDPVWRRGMSAREFQNQYLPALKSFDQWSDLLQGHPYALFMSFSKASEYSCQGLKRWLAMLLEAEYRLKGSPLPPRLILEELLLAMLKGRPKVPI